jgi:hypothetical protein
LLGEIGQGRSELSAVTGWTIAGEIRTVSA